MTDNFLSSSSSTWLNSRDEADAYCASYAAAQGISGSDFRIVYSTPEEDARDHLAYESGTGAQVYDRYGTLVDNANLWDGSDISLRDMKSWTITASWNDGRSYECSGSYPAGSWPICQYCTQKFACGSASDNPFEPRPCCWTGTRAIVCMGTRD